MNGKWAGIAALVLVATTNAGALRAQDGDEGRATINAELKSRLVSPAGETAIGGRLSAFLRLDSGAVDGGRVRVGGLNLLYTDVPAKAVGGQTGEEDGAGSLGFVIDAVVGGDHQGLVYDPEGPALEGALRGRISHSSFNAELGTGAGRRGDHVFEGVSQAATLKLRIELEKPLESFRGDGEIGQLRGEVEFSLEAEPLREREIPGYRLEPLERVPLVIDVGWWWHFEVAKRLCVQPVRIGRFVWNGGWPPFGAGGGWTVAYSGDGLPFGLPGANLQWGKADVVFTVRDWKTVFNDAYATLSESEANALRATVQDDDCVEVFFVDRFSPNAQWGGGATWAAGLAETQIVSSDENADHGIDLTHLAHELGHAIALMHPGLGFPSASAPYLADGSGGTLMCPSGFMNDNPPFNSQANKDNVQNPLFTFALKIVGPGPDCQDDADCGACF